MNIAIIPARGGSRRIPGKNIRMFHGKPIIAYSIEAAWACGLFDSVIVSTDHQEVAMVAEAHAAQVHYRPVELGADRVGTLSVAAEAARIHGRNAEFVCCIYATAPMLLARDIVRGLQTIRYANAHHCISVGANPLRDAAQFYWSRGDSIRAEEGYYEYLTVLEVIEGSRICDINTEDDWRRAEQMYAALHPEGAHG